MKATFFIILSGLFPSLTIAQADTFKSLADKGNGFAEKQEISMALDCYDKALATGTDNTADMVWIASIAGIYAQQINESAKALSFFKVAVDHGCTDQDIFDRYIKLAGQSGDKKQEERAILSVCRNVGDSSGKYTGKLVAFYYSNGQFDRVIAVSDSLSAISPQKNDVRNLNALALEKTGNENKAVAIYEGILANDPDNKTATSRLGLASYNKAVAIYETAKAKYMAISKPTEEQYAVMMKQFDVATGFYQKSVVLLEKAYQNDPARQVKEMLHKAYTRLGNKEKAALYQ
jgi:tetratricopeptide (TPR) repeat protein